MLGSYSLNCDPTKGWLNGWIQNLMTSSLRSLKDGRDQSGEFASGPTSVFLRRLHFHGQQESDLVFPCPFQPHTSAQGMATMRSMSFLGHLHPQPMFFQSVSLGRGFHLHEEVRRGDPRHQPRKSRVGYLSPKNVVPNLGCASPQKFVIKYVNKYSPRCPMASFDTCSPAGQPP